MEKEDDVIEEIEKSEHENDITMKEELAKVKDELDSVKEELYKARESSDNNLNRLKYMMADVDNYRKQMEKQIASKIESSRAELLMKFL
ncbi:MAG TPA: hypothetical protein VFI70_05315, partial [Nitrososphaeraceae archaeon]|nr:hypothetical protein [Nitrososphaeraceae archaeon]